MQREATARRTALCLVATAVLAGCGDDGASPTPDGGTPDGGTLAVMAPVIPWWDSATATGEPAIAAPVLGPCPMGWRATRTDTGVELCDPWPVGGPLTCPIGQAHFAGDPACAPVGAACPAGDFPEGLPPDGSVRFVRAGATGGDGTRARPFGTIGEALAGATSGATIAIAKGRYDEMVTPAAGVTLWGACSAETILTQSAGVPPGTPGGAVYVRAAGVVVRDLQVADAALIGIWIEAPGTLDLQGVVVSRATTGGINVEPGGRLTAREIAVRDTRPRVRDSVGGHGLSVDNGEATLTRAVFDHNTYAGIVVTRGHMSASDLVVRDTQPEASDGIEGFGVAGGPGSTVEIMRAVLERNHTLALGMQGVGGTLAASDIVVRGTLSRASDGLGGVAVVARAGASATVTRMFAEGNRESDVYANTGGSIVATDVVLRDTEASTAVALAGQGVFASGESSSISVTRAVIERSRSVAVLTQGVGSTVRLEDVRIRDVRPPASEPASGAGGIAVLFGGQATLERVAIERTRANCIEVGADGSALDATDVIVRDVASNPGAFGIGVGLLGGDGATVTASRLVVTGAQGVGVMANGGSRISLADAVVRDGRAEPALRTMGYGVMAQLGATASLERVHLERNRDISLLAVADAQVTGRDVTISETMQRDCVDSTCATSAAGHAILSARDADVSLERFSVDRAALCGILVADGASALLRTGTVSGTRIGACVQIDGYDTTTLGGDVHYVGNESNLQATMLPVPGTSTLPTPTPHDAL